MERVAAPCTEELFWEEVALIGWQDKNPRRFYDKAKARLLRRWTGEFLEEFDEMKEQLYVKLSKAVTDAESRGWESGGETCGCGDDGFSDLIHHVIGLGREEYEASLADPMRVIKRGQEGRYEESFGYCIPYKSDAELITKSTYIRRAEQIVENLQGLKDSRFGEEFEDLDGLLALMKRVVAGEVELLQTEGLGDRVKKLREEREQRYRRELEDLNTLKTQGWLFDNTVSDARSYLGEEEAA
jgi:hypothetical protein